MHGKAKYTIWMRYALFFLAVLCTAAKGKVIFVDSDAIAVFDGSSWAFAYQTLQEAIVQVRPGDEIRIAEGIYKPDRWPTRPWGRSGSIEITASGDRTETFELINGVTFKGGYAGYGKPYPDLRDFNLYQTTLSGDLEGNDVDIISSEDLLVESSRAENSYNVVTGSGAAVLDGFTITGGNANVSSFSKGGGLYNRYGVVEIINCKFIANSAKSDGGAIYNELSNTTLTNCSFIGNSAGSGGGMYNKMSNPNLTNCTFSNNSAVSLGGAMTNYQSDLSLDGCTFSANRAENGGGIHNNRSNPNLTSCIFSENSARYGGGVYNSSDCRLVLTNCAFYGNSGTDYGGGMYNFGSELTLSNSIFTGNYARIYGAGMSNNNSDLVLTNCTFSSNSAPNGSSVTCNSRSSRSNVVIVNCVFWGGGEEIWQGDHSVIDISYSNIIYDGQDNSGNINADPLFVDPNGPDNIPGTEDDDLRLAPLSPCIDTGSLQYVAGPNETDFNGNPRVVGDRVDMGAYEYQGIIYVDNYGLDEPWQIDPVEDGSEIHPFHTIQKAIDVAEDGQTVLVRSGAAYSRIDFMGKAITVAGTDGAAIIEAPLENTRTGSVERKSIDGVIFHTGEGPDSVLKNFVIRYCSTAISLNYGSSPTIRNLTIVDNDFGISAYENSNPDISNCIFWNNRDGDQFQCDVRYSCLEDETPGVGNISANPLFVDAANGDYHLLSQGWYWNTLGESWTWNEHFTSPCIDMGDPTSPLSDEPMSVSRDPNNEYGINLYINMGAYGGTCQASIAPPFWFPEPDFDPPQPNPAQWAHNCEPKEVYHGGGVFDYWVRMTAAEATDASGLVEYFFDCTTEPAFRSGWQSACDYEVLVGGAGQGHCFRVKARDQFGNETEWSEELVAG